MERIMRRNVLTGQDVSFSEDSIMLNAHFLPDMQSHSLHLPARTQSSDRLRTTMVHNKDFLMKAGLLGVIVAVIGAINDPVVLADPSYAMAGALALGALFGVFAGGAASKPLDYSVLCQELLGNFFTALGIGPWLAPWLAARCGILTPGYPWFMLCGFTLGVCGLAIVRAARSDIVAAFRGWLLSTVGSPPKQ